MKLSNFLEGLQLLKAHYKDGDGYHTGAEHDIFYAYPTDTPLTVEEVRRMIALDWFQPEAPENEEGEFTAATYDPDEGWAAFT